MLVLGVKLFIKSADILKYAEEQGEICESRFVSPCLGQLQCLMFYLHSLQDLKGVECGGRRGGGGAEEEGVGTILEELMQNNAIKTQFLAQFKILVAYCELYLEA